MTIAISDRKRQQRLDGIFREVAEEVGRRVNVTFSVSRASNDTYPWWVVTRFTNADDADKIVDVSIECRRRDNALEIKADVALETGFVLSELAVTEPISPSSNGTDESISDLSLERIEAFLRGQVETIGGAIG